MKKHLLNNRYWYLFSILIFIFGITTFLLLRDNLSFIDDTVYNFIKIFKNDSLTNIFKIISNLASPIVLILITVLTSFIKDKKYFRMISLNLIIVTLLNQLLKIVFSRPRPFDMIIKEFGYSFPSGHSMASMAFYGFFAYIIYKKVNNKYIKYLSIFGIFTIIFLIGLSRIYLRVHYPSDVIAGFCLSLSYLIIYIYVSASKKI